MNYLSLPDLNVIADIICRFNMKIDYLINVPCHIWLGAKGENKSGMYYPKFTINDTMYSATRIMYYWHYKIDPGILNVCHNCYPNPDNSLCVNPAHLWIGTQSANAKDAYNKGRPSPTGGAIFTNEEIRLIRTLYAQGQTLQQIADQYGVHIMTIHRIIVRKTYRHVK